MSDSSQQTISIPSLLFLTAVAALTIRYFFFSSSSANPTASRSNLRIANPADVEQVASMFPQIGRREIIWDLQRNGGSVAATTERILSRGSLDEPPPSFQPPPPPSPPGGTTPSTARLITGQAKGPEHIDLIKRYNLSAKLSSEEPPEPEDEKTRSAASWSNNKNERQALLQRRREEMILNARKKLQQKEKGKGKEVA